MLAAHGAALLLCLAPPAHADITVVHGRPLYFATDSGSFVVKGRQEGPHYDQITEGQVIDGKAYYRATRKGKTCVASNLDELDCRDQISSLEVKRGHIVYTFTKVQPDGERIAYVGVEDGPLKTGYRHIKLANHVGGQPLYAAQTSGGWAVVVGKQAGPVYEDISQLLVAGGKVIYVAKRAGRFYVSNDGQVSGPYEQVERIELRADKPLYSARTGKNRWMFVYGDSSFGPYTEAPYQYMMADGSLLFAARDPKDSKDVLIHGGNELDRCLVLQNLQYVEGKPLYSCYRRGGTYAVYGSQRYGPHGGVSNLQVVDGKPLFMAGFLNATSIQHGNSATAPQGVTSTHSQLFFSSGRPLYVMSRHDGKYRHVVYGTYISRFFDGIDATSLTLYGDKPVFAAWRGRFRYVVIGTDERGPYDGILGVITFPENKPLYVVKKQSKEYVVFDQKEEGPYDRVWELSVHQGKLLYFAKRDCREFVVYGGVEGKKYRSVAKQLPESRLALASRECPSK